MAEGAPLDLLEYQTEFIDKYRKDLDTLVEILKDAVPDDIDVSEYESTGDKLSEGAFKLNGISTPISSMAYAEMYDDVISLLRYNIIISASRKNYYEMEIDEIEKHNEFLDKRKAFFETGLQVQQDIEQQVNSSGAAV